MITDREKESIRAGIYVIARAGREAMELIVNMVKSEVIEDVDFEEACEQMQAALEELDRRP